MATIRKSNDSYNVAIRKKNKKMYASFKDETTAKIWAKYHEDLIDAMENFQVKPESYITLEQCLELKVKSLIERIADKKTIQDFQNTLIHFSEIKDVPFGEITSDIIRELISKQSNSVVKRGGSKNNPNSGNLRIISETTILNRLRYLSAVFSYMVEKGANIINPAQIVVNQIKMSIIKKGEVILEDE